MFNLTLKRQKKLQKFFAVFTVLSLILQIGSGVFLFRPAFAEETVVDSEPVEEIVEEPTPVEEGTIDETPAEESEEEVVPTPEPTTTPPEELTSEEPSMEEEPVLEETPTLTVEQTEETVEKEIVEEVSEETPVERGLEPDLEEPETAEESAKLNPSVFTDKEDYAPGETVKITGENFPVNTTLTIRVTRPDGSIVKGDGSFEPGSDEVSTDEEGKFEYFYQLNGIEGEYLVEVLDASGAVLATTTFTDNPGLVCVDDSAGANDVPGQKDLTQMCVDYSVAPLYITWNWDDISWSGKNTGDACSLYDSDGDGFANYSFCVTIGGDPAVIDSYNLYSCDDDKAERCSKNKSEAFSLSSCYVQGGTDPFPAGDFYPQDTQAVCSVDLSEVGGSSSALIDVCSYPSRQPNSDPSDCIIYIPQKGKLEVVKDLDPDTDSGLFNLYIDGVINVNDVGDSGTTGEQVLDPGSYDVGETAGTNTDLNNYSTSIECRDQNGLGSIVASGSGAGPLSVIVSKDDDIVCTITNILQQSTLTLIKEVVNNNGGQATEVNFQAYIDSSPVPWNTSQTLNAGSYTVSESTLAGYQASDWSGDCAVDGRVTLAPGDNKTCTIINDDIPSKLTVTKVVVNDNGGTKTVADFPLFVDGNPVVSGEQNTFLVGDHLVSETTDSGYTATISGDCDAQGNVALALGEEKSCTITNDDIAPTLTLEKTVTNDNGGTASETNFQAYIDGSPVPWGVPQTLGVGSHAVSESTVFGYQASSWGGDCAADGSVTLNPGDNKTCTITNDDIAPKLTVNKVVVNDNGGSKVIADFPLFVDGSPVSSGVQNAYLAGAHLVSETTDSGYTATISGDCDAQGNVALGVGEGKSCTIINDDKPATLTVIKIVDNSNGGGLVPADFSIYVSGNNVSNPSFSGSASGTQVTLDAGGYSVTEDPIFGYNPTFSADCSGTISNGESKVCTITNEDVPPTLTVVKEVVNDDGGSKQVSDFALFVDAIPVTSGVANTLMSNVQYTLSEITLPGYSASTWSGGCASDGTITLNPGDNKTCTITNDDQPAYLTVIKHVVNDDNGSAVAGDFTMTIGGVTVIGGSSFPGDESGTTRQVYPGTYNVTETGPSGYSDSYNNCTGSIDLGESKTCTITNDDIAPTLTLVKVIINDDGGNLTEGDFKAYIDSSPVPWGSAQTLTVGSHTASEDGVFGYQASDWGGDCAADGSVYLAAGDNKTCYITNDDIAPRLTLVKEVTNNDGGQAQPTDWDLYASGERGFGGKSPVSSSVKAGETYSLTEEDGPRGYTAGDWVCNGGTQNGNLITLSVADDVTCTITNDDIAPTLTLEKTVVNDDGGSATKADFQAYINGSPVDWDVLRTLSAGFHTASESGLPGYAASAWGGDCAADGTITLGPGENKTCTITNDDQSAILIVKKHVINDNGGSQVAGDFTMNVTGTNVSNPSFLGDEAGTSVTLDAGSYSVDENPMNGYTKTIGADCSGTIANGETKTCTITNNDIAPKLTLIKSVNNDNGGNAGENDFGISVGGTSVNSGETLVLEANQPYILDEVGLAGYDFVSLTGDAKCPIQLGGTITLDEGDDIACIITNDDQFGRIIIDKVTDPVGDWQSFDFALTGGLSSLNLSFSLTDTATPFDSGPILPGLGYSVSETVPGGWDLTSAICSDESPAGRIEISAGETVTCIFTNTKLGSIGDYVWEDIDGEGDQDAGEPGISGVTVNLYQDDGDGIFEPGIDDGLPIDSNTTALNGLYLFDNLVAGIYWVDVDDSTLPAGYVITTTNDPLLVNLDPGENELGADFGYVAAIISLSLAKTNDKVGLTASPGDTATFTLTITNDGPGTAYDVVVTDVLPSGFSYVDNSGAIDGASTNPSISGSVLSWSLGKIAASGSVVITYQAKTASDLESGTYTNLAFASGYNRSADAEEREKSETGIVDSTVKLAVVKSYSAAITGSVLGITTTKVGEVLGAATGAPTIYVVLALLMLILGIVFRYWQELKRFSLRKILRGIILVLAFLVFTAGIVQAGTLEVAIADLPEYLHTDTFKIYYTALGTEGNPITADFYYRKDGEATWKKIDGTVSGETGNVQLDNNYLPDEGRYYFKVEAASGGLTDSDETTTIIDRTAPGTPSEYGKERKSRTGFRLSWKNPSDSDFDKVLIYRSKERDFNADDGNKVGEAGGAPDSKVSWDDSGLENDVEYYYALRAVDKAGNASDLTGDGGSTTYEETIVEVTPTPGPAGAEEVVVLPEEKAEEGQILGEESEEETITEEVVPEAVSEEEKGLVKGVTEAARKFSWVWFVLGGAVIIAIGYWFLKKEEQEK